MELRLHKNATTPAVRLAIQQSSEPVRALARRYNISVDTVMRWKHRSSVEDAPVIAKRLQTTLTPAQEEVVVALRTMLWLSLDDLLAVVHEFIHPTMLRSSLHRLLKRRGISTKPIEQQQKKRAHSKPTILVMYISTSNTCR